MFNNLTQRVLNPPLEGAQTGTFWNLGTVCETIHMLYTEKEIVRVCRKKFEEVKSNRVFLKYSSMRELTYLWFSWFCQNLKLRKETLRCYNNHVFEKGNEPNSDGKSNLRRLQQQKSLSLKRTVPPRACFITETPETQQQCQPSWRKGSWKLSDAKSSCFWKSESKI